MRFLPVVLLVCLSPAPFVAAQTVKPSNPAPMNGIWELTQMTQTKQMTQVTQAVPGELRLPMPAGELFIVSGELRGNYGCGRYQGSLNAASNAIKVNVRRLPPRPSERCLFAGRGAFVDTLNAAAQYTLSRDHLVLFSKAGRLTFERIGFVTPGKK